MNEEERWLFDLQGYVVVKNAIPANRLSAMNAWIDLQSERDPKWKGQPGVSHLAELLTWGPDFLSLLDNSLVLPYLKVLLGEHLRLDHDYAIFLQPGGNGMCLHGGGAPHDPSQFYYVNNGRMYNGLMVAAYSLTEVPPGAGGFACVPGSHKSNFVAPEDIAELRRPSPVVQQVPVQAGDCIVFTEALLHGTLPWHGPGPRRTLYFKFSPGHLAWGFHSYDPIPGNAAYEAIAPNLNKAQQILLDPPRIYQKRAVP